VIDGLECALRESRQAGLAELRGVLLEVLDASRVTGRLTGEQGLKRRTVYRLGFQIDGQPRTLVVKHLSLACAQRNQLAITSWLPAVGLGQRCPALLGVAAERSGQCIWHVYEDLGDQVLDTTNPERARVEAAVDLIAGLHVRFAEHGLLPECRLHGYDLGMAFYVANIRDAIRGVESLQPPLFDLDPGRAALRDRLLRRLSKLLDEGPDRARVMTELGGPETLLHGDLWPKNILAVPTDGGLQTKLIDWDATGVGPLTYDLSTFLYRFPVQHRPWILDRYQQSVAPLAWRAPAAADLNLLLETAELSRLANSLVWPCVAAAQTQAPWAFDSLAEIERWFEALEPAM
jgi:Phosphotransferase enzyme family